MRGLHARNLVWSLQPLWGIITFILLTRKQVQKNEVTRPRSLSWEIAGGFSHPGPFLSAPFIIGVHLRLARRVSHLHFTEQIDARCN